MVLSRKNPECSPKLCVFSNLGDFLPRNSLLVANNTRVLPARLRGSRKSGGKVEYLQLTPLPLLQITSAGKNNSAVCEALLRPAGRIRLGEILNFGKLKVIPLARGEYGRTQVELRWQGNLEKIFQTCGELPLPPYLGRSAEKRDETDYQTIFASQTGAVAAPTAGLHFTSEHLERLQREHGCGICEITLHVGYGTFTPVRSPDIRKHKMHAEFVEISAEVASEIREAKESGRPVVAIGTTSLRALEGAFALKGEIGAFHGWTDIFIYPGKTLKVADGLLTNFHLPRSSLLMLVAAMTGRSRLLAAYAEAMKQNFRFFSYGDAMLII